VGRGRRCCCCNDLYVNNNNGLAERLRLGGTYPNETIDRNPANDGTAKWNNIFTVDPYNKVIISAVGSTSSGANTPLHMFDWSTFSETVIGTTQGDTALLSPRLMGGLAVDYTGKRIFYASLFSRDDAHSTAVAQIRRMNYDGTNDVQVTTENLTNTGSGFTANWNICYDPRTDRIYYIFTAAQGGSNCTVKTCKSDGSGKSTLASFTSAGARTNNSSDISTKHNLLVWAQLWPISPEQDDIMVLPLSGGTPSSILTSVSTDTIKRRFCGVQFSEKLDKIIYQSIVFSGGPTGNIRNKINTANIDGTGEATLMDGTQLPIFLDNNPTLEIELGCGFEDSGGKFNGPG
jgi:hypothetical protein